MKQTLMAISILLTLNLFGQKSIKEDFINQVANEEVPENFKYYFLLPKSFEQKK